MSAEINPIDITLASVYEAGGIAKKGIEPVAEVGFDRLCMWLMYAASSHEGLRQFMLPLIGRYYYRATLRDEERRTKYFAGTIKPSNIRYLPEATEAKVA